MSKCPTCKSPAPHLHPAVQHEGEVELCRDQYHRQLTSQNTAKKIADVERWFSPGNPGYRGAETPSQAAASGCGQS